MLYVFTGTDREKVREATEKERERVAKKIDVVRITDANTVADLQAALSGGGMFGGDRTVVLSDVCANEEMKTILLAELPRLKESEEVFFVLEGKLDAQTRKTLEKHAEKFERFDTKKEREGGEIFALAFALKKGDRKNLWVNYLRALARNEAPEAIHGVLFWGAKDMVLKARAGSAECARGAQLVAELAELPHEARRNGVELEYALESYILRGSRGR